MTVHEAIQVLAKTVLELSTLLEEHAEKDLTRPSTAYPEYIQRIREQKEAAGMVLAQLKYEQPSFAAPCPQ